MNDKLRKQLIDHATDFVFRMKDGDVVLLQRVHDWDEPLDKWTVTRGREMWHKGRGDWGPSRPPSRRSLNMRCQVEMSLKEAYSVILLDLI